MLLQVQIEIFWKINIIFKKGGGKNMQFIEAVVKENSLSKLIFGGAGINLNRKLFLA